MTAEELKSAITPKSKVFLFSSPCNPSGSVYSKDELAQLVKVFEQHPSISIISDEIYEYINFVGKHESIAQFPSVKDRVMIVNGLSKGYAMTGYRLGYIAAPVVVAKACEKLQGQFTSGTNAVTQRATIAALIGDQQPTQDMNKEFERRKKRVIQLVSEVPGWKLAEPDGAFYVFPDVSVYYGKSNGEEKIQNADDLCMYLLNTAHVSTVTGRAFGTPNCIRLSFANSLDKIEEAYRRIKKALADLK
jgi:aspartate aminotransferase